ncbi:MAG: hypothetical protein NXI24_08340 [bacterium]|nr:hypothetical protein [bacterium]
MSGKTGSTDSSPDSGGHEDRVYPEFNGYSGREIQIRLEALDNLLNHELESEYHKAGLRLEEQEEMAREASAAAVKTLEKESAAPIAGRNSITKLGDPFLVIAHRGWSGSYPENTLIGMREAIKLGCHMIEFDVTLSSDRRPIIIHDDSLTRTTNGCGQVSELSYRELRKLDAGSWFHPKYMGARLPSLDEILLISRGSGIMVNIEIKKECLDDELRDDGIEHQVINAVRKYKVEDRVVVSCFRWDAIERIHQLAPELETALLHYKDVGRLEPAFLKEKYGIMSFNPHSIDLNQKFVDRCHEVDLKVIPFTINSYRDMEQYIDMDVDGMFTNHPNRLFRFIEEHDTRLNRLDEKESRENVKDMNDAVQRLEMEIMDKARRRARWRTKRLLLEAERARIKS